LNGLERVLKTIQLQEPDVVPHFENMIHPKVRDAILPGASYDDFVEFMDLDAVVFHDQANWRYETLDASKMIMRNQWGAIVRFTSEEVAHPLEPAIKTEKDLDTYIPPDPDLTWRYSNLKKIVKRFKGEKAIIIFVNGVFNMAKEALLGDVEYFKAMIKNPDIIHRVNEIVLNYNLGYINNCLDSGADMVFDGGDWAVTDGPWVSRDFTQRFIVPPFRRVAEFCHSRGVPCLKHTDGNVWPIFDLIVEAGANLVHPIDPGAGMDIGEVKTKYGHKVCLMGNIDCGPLLCNGSVEEVQEEVKNCIRKAGTGGGLICSSSNTIHSGVKPDNYLAMVKAIREYGQYPLNK
jgi:uroporphyrinogen decarboxylase